MAQKENDGSWDFTFALHHCVSLSKSRHSAPARFGYPHPGTWHMYKQDGYTLCHKLPRVKNISYYVSLQSPALLGPQFWWFVRYKY